MIQAFVSHNIELVAKGRPKMGKWGVYTPAKTRQFELALKNVFCNLPQVAKKEGQNFGLNLPIACACEVEIIFYFAKPKTAKRKEHTVRPDLDNLVKSVCDSANKILWNDDSLIVKLNAEKRYSKDNTNGFILTVKT